MQGSFEVVAQVTPRIVAGDGALGRLGVLLRELGARRVVLATSPSMASSQVFEASVRGLGDGLVGRFCGMRSHAPMEDVLALADLCRTAEAEAVVSLGGASVIDGAKALATLAEGSRLVHVAVPALFGGAEVTPFAGVTERGRKLRLSGSSVRPDAVVLDPVVPNALPDGLLAASFLNAVSHCYEGFFSVDASPLSDAYYLRAATLMARAIAGFRTSSRLESLAAAQAASVRAALPAVRMGMGHALVHAVSPILGTSHALTHAIVVRVVAGHHAKTDDQFRREELARALCMDLQGPGSRGRADPLVVRLTGLLEEAGVPLGLAHLGITWPAIQSALPDIEQAMADFSTGLSGRSEIELLMADVWSGDLNG
ncbi:iron-containing alcohol dehydrogenase [Sinomonas susongensis]|uniref:iron-containing alcohol dehydrogenase n=1 Tax=Sinomonas susongensis TaxID=1324851 RepID=UPI00110938B9|nr:iron-containing alcohol dehydrogenase [Sinomonas susongensis]